MPREARQKLNARAGKKEGGWEQKGLSQDRIAKLADVANNTIIKIEQGENINPTLEALKKVAKALEVSVDELIK